MSRFPLDSFYYQINSILEHNKKLKPNLPESSMKKVLTKRTPSRLETWLCETLPGNMTILEENGHCTKKDSKCQYYESSTSICKKKTYTPTRLNEYLTT